ncbi:hypothetical protein KBB96_04785 [Luteolibacter ambystomatis]|uniref:Type II secretion system protein GspD n=1 Tax=Luteolibacter ambystomatis TaxID=2824561 RepID=A0A975PFS9_9BACT|nr:secretin N-terminal domain-containing protein [Luteolibacter ambystomatis]QUE52209.1 hypothetical protein KBB96_04785 [Luteolibacter ambystomatis]
MHAIRRLVPLGLIALSSAFAQENPEQVPPIPPNVPVPGNAAGPTQNPAAPAPGGNRAPGANRLPAPGAQANQDNIPLEDRKLVETINGAKVTGAELADYYHEYTGRRVVVSVAASQAEFSFILQASPKDPLTFKKAADLLKMAALTEGFVFVPAGEGVDRLLFSGNPSNNPKGLVGVFNEHDVLPEEDLVVAYVMNFQYLKPEQAKTIFDGVVGQSTGNYSSVVPVANASALVITDNISVIRKLIQLKEEIDKPSGDLKSKFIKVQYADVTELAQTLNEIFSAQAQTQRTAGIQQAVPQPAPGGAPGQVGNRTSSAGEEIPPQIVPDARTNRIFIRASAVDLAMVEQLVKDFDTKTDDRNFLRRKLRFLTAGDFLGIAGDALTRAFTGTGSGGSGGAGAGSTGANFGGGGGGNRSSGGGTRTNNSGASGRNSMGTSASSGGSFGSGGSSFGSGGGSGSGSGSGGGLGSSSVSEPNVSTAPQSLLVGRTLLVADNITNSIIVQGPPASVEVIEKLLDQVDVKADQVMISTVFGQLTVNDDLNYGVDFLKTFGNKKTGVAGGSTPVAGDDSPSVPINPATLLTPANFPASNGLNIYGTIGRSYSIYLSALQATGNFTVLSRPSIYTANNKKGLISSGQQIAVPTNTYNNTGSGGTTGGLQTNIEYKDVVLKLEVVPLINSADEITLQIALISDEVGANQTVGELTVPTIITREMTTTVTVPNNQTVVLGGLIISRDRDSVSGIPILSRIPGLGKLFSSTSKEKEKSELLIFMQPSIVRADKQLDAVQTDMDRRYSLSPDLRNFGDGPGSIPPPDGIVPVTEKYSKGTKKAATSDYDAPAKRTSTSGTKAFRRPR